MADEMKEAIARLKAESAKEAKTFLPEGRAAGEKWAKETARPSELKRLARAVQYSAPKGQIATAESYVAEDEEDAPPIDMRLCWDITGNSETDEEAFWKKHLGDAAKMMQDESYATGFIAGALWVWSEFKAAG